MNLLPAIEPALHTFTESCSKKGHPVFHGLAYLM